MKVLFIGGTGIISSACSELAIRRGIDLYLLNRGQSSRPVPEGATVLQGDIRDRRSAAAAVEGHTFDTVVDWVAFTPEHVETDLALWRGRTDQYIFISSASVYQKPPAHLPIVESTPLYNPFWPYSQAKIACEERLMRAYREEGFPVTIVRPSHTYDARSLPLFGGYTVIDRLRKGKPAIIHGDGTSLWVMTHHRDFAKGFVGLLANPQTIGENFHITSDEVLTWNQIIQALGRAAGVSVDSATDIVGVPSATIAAFDKDWGAGNLGDKSHSVIFDNSKIKRFVPDFVATIPFARGAEEIMAWYDADPARQAVDAQADALMDRLIAAQQSIKP